jgi:hypothetical protein
VDTAETKVNATNVAKLMQLFQVPIMDPPDGAPVALSDVMTPMGVKDLVYVAGQHGLLTAFDGITGMTVWHAGFTSTGYSNSAPAIDPNRQFIYVNTADSMIHKLQVGDGTEIKTGGWPIPTGTGKPSGQLAMGTDKSGVSYLYATNNGSGRATVVNLATGMTHVFNLACANLPDTQTPAACDRGANPWARSPVFVADLQKVFIGTGTNDGSGQFIAGKVWRTSWVALPPDGHTTMMAGGGYPLDSYTPSDWASVVGGDRDSSVGGLIPLPTGYSMKYPHLAVQPGKDGRIRVINLENMSGKGAPGNVGGELQLLNAPLGLMRSWGAAWVNPADKVAWVFVGGNAGVAAYTMNLDAAGTPTLTQSWVKTIGWTPAPFVANGVLYVTGGAGEHTGGSATHPINAMDPVTGNVLWTANVGPHHWSSPIMVNGILYMADGHSGGCDVANGSPTCTPQGPGNLTAWSIK